METWSLSVLEKEAWSLCQFQQRRRGLYVSSGKGDMFSVSSSKIGVATVSVLVKEERGVAFVNHIVSYHAALKQLCINHPITDYILRCDLYNLRRGNTHRQIISRYSSLFHNSPTCKWAINAHWRPPVLLCLPPGTKHWWALAYAEVHWDVRFFLLCLTDSFGNSQAEVSRVWLCGGSCLPK